MKRLHVPRTPLWPAACLVLTLAGTAAAQGTAEQRDACTPDALKLCADTIPDVARTTACMKRHEAELSPRCHAVFETPDSGERDTRRARRAADEEPTPLASRRERRRLADAPEHYDAPSRPRRGGEAVEDGYPDVRGGPADGGTGPDVRYFPPGDGPDEPGYGVAPYGEGRRYAEPGDRDGPRFGGRGDGDDWGRPGPRRYGSPDFDRDDYRAGAPDDR